MKKTFSKQKAFSVLLFTIIIFSLGVFLGNYNTSKKLNTVLDMSEQLQIDTLGIETTFDLLKNNLCENDDSLFLTDNLYTLSERLTYMENALGVDDERVLQLKKYYFILESKHWLLAKERKDKCVNKGDKLNNTIVLYFYSNEGDCPMCEEQGYVLSYFRNKYSNMKIYSFDANINSSPVVSVLKKLYNISDENLPGLIINNRANSGYLNSDDFVNFVESNS